MNSQIQKEKKKWWNCGITNFREGTKTFLGKQNMGRLFEIGELMIRSCQGLGGVS